MNQAFTGAAIAAVIAVCWLLGRPRRPLLRSTDTTAVAALNRNQIERLFTAPSERDTAGGETGPSAVIAAPTRVVWPRDARNRSLLLSELEQQFQQGGLPRRQALAACLAWGDRSALPLIRRGLRDSDPAVVALAAKAISPFRGRSTMPANLAQRAAKAPRTVSRTR
jgi:hypothetical protein